MPTATHASVLAREQESQNPPPLYRIVFNVVKENLFETPAVTPRSNRDLRLFKQGLLAREYRQGPARRRPRWRQIARTRLRSNRGFRSAEADECLPSG